MQKAESIQVLAKNRATQIKKWREILEALKDFLIGVVNLEFTEDGVQLLAMDGSQTAMAYLFLKSSGFVEYMCKSPQSVGIKISDLLKAIKAMNNAEDMTFKVSQTEKNTELIITGSDERKATTIDFNLVSLETDPKRFRIPHTEWCRTIQIPTKDFKGYVTNLAGTNSDVMLIEWHDRVLSLSAQEDNRKCRISINTVEKSINEPPLDRPESAAKRQRMSSDSMPVSPPLVADDVPDFRERFELKYMQYFTKAEPLNAVVRVLLRNSFPLCLTYEITEFGSLTFFLNPKIDEDDEEPVGEYNEF